MFVIQQKVTISMANYNEAYEKTCAHEGGYVFDPDDAGGETYKGVSRRYNPSWPGWKLIDDIKANNGNNNLSKQLDNNTDLQEQVRSFYKQLYWDQFWGDSVPDQAIANELFDTSVNLGVRRAVKYLQTGLNLLNRNQKNYNDIGVDGFFGPGTLGALNKYLKQDPCAPLVKIMNTLQGMHYITYMEKNPAQEKYARGWLNRT